MKRLWERLKNHWKITSDFQVVVILMVFAFSGFSTLYVHNYIDFLLGVDEDSQFWIKALIFILLVLPIFNLFLLIWGTILGQKQFVIRFIKVKIRLVTGRLKKTELK